MADSWRSQFCYSGRQAVAISVSARIAIAGLPRTAEHVQTHLDCVLRDPIVSGSFLFRLVARLALGGTLSRSPLYARDAANEPSRRESWSPIIPAFGAGIE